MRTVIKLKISSVLTIERKTDNFRAILWRTVHLPRYCGLCYEFSRISGAHPNEPVRSLPSGGGGHQLVSRAKRHLRQELPQRPRNWLAVLRRVYRHDETISWYSLFTPSFTGVSHCGKTEGLTTSEKSRLHSRQEKTRRHKYLVENY